MNNRLINGGNEERNEERMEGRNCEKKDGNKWEKYSMIGRIEGKHDGRNIGVRSKSKKVGGRWKKEK